MTDHDDSPNPNRPGDATGAWPMADRPRPEASGAVDTLPRVTPPDAEHPEDFASYDGLAPNQAWVAGGAGSGETRHSGLRLALMLLAVVAGTVLFGPYVFIIIGGLLISIFLHEFGHYWTAKKSGMKVTEYFLGFGPRLWSFRRGETEYGIKLIPAGAYVRIIGMNQFEEVDPADEARTYREQSAPKRMAVVLAGPFMNILIALVLLASFFALHGRVSDTDWFVGTVQPNSAASAVGLQSNDHILTVDGEPVTDFDHFRDQIDAKAGQHIAIVVDRGGQKVTLEPTLGWRLNTQSAEAIPSQPALNANDLVTSADGQPVTTYEDLRVKLAEPGDPVTLNIDRRGHSYTLIVNRPVALPEKQASGFLGVKPDFPTVAETPVGALGETFRLFGTAATGTFSGFGRLFTPDGASNYARQLADTTRSSTVPEAKPNVLTPVAGSPAADATNPDADVQVVSIIGIVQLGSGAAQRGLWEFIFVLGLVNFALALINLLPVLPFDGGHAVIAAYEGVRGAIRGEKYTADLTKMMPIAYGVFGLLLLIGLSSVYLNIMNPVSYSP